MEGTSNKIEFLLHWFAEFANYKRLESLLKKARF